MICWSCQSANPDQAKFCASCGSKMLPEPGVEAACRSCGAPLPLEARFCGYCGTPEPLATSSAEATESVKPSGELARAIAAGPGEATALAYDDDAEEDEALAALEEVGDQPSPEPELEDDEEEATIIRSGIEELPLAPPGPAPRPKEPTEPARVAKARTLKERMAGEGPSPGAYSKKGPSLRARESGKPPPPPPLGRRPAVPQSSSPSMLETKVRPAKPGEGAARGFAKGRPGLAPPPPVAGKTRITPAPKPGSPKKGVASAPAAMTRGQTAPTEGAEPTPVATRGSTAPTEAAEPTPVATRGSTAPTEAAEPTPAATRGSTAPTEGAEPTPVATRGSTAPTEAAEPTPAATRGSTAPTEAAEPTPAATRGSTAPTEGAEPTPAATRGSTAPTEGAEPTPVTTRGGTAPIAAAELASPIGPARPGPGRSRMPRTVTAPQKAVFSSPRPDTAAILAPPAGWPDITDELAEIRFSAIQGFDDDTRKAISDLRARFPGHPEVDILAEELGEATSSRPSLLEEDADKPTPVEGPPPRGRGLAPSAAEEAPAPAVAAESLEEPVEEVAETIAMPSLASMGVVASETPATPGPVSPQAPASETVVAPRPSAPVPPAPLGSPAVVDAAAVQPAPVTSTEAVEPVEPESSEGPGSLVETPMEDPPPAVTGRTLPPSTAEPAVTGRTIPPSAEPAVTGHTMLPTTAPAEPASPPELLVEPAEPAPLPELLVEPAEPAPPPELLVEPAEPAPPPELSVELLPPPEVSEPEPVELGALVEPELAGPSEPEAIEPLVPSEPEAIEPLVAIEPLASSELESFEPEPPDPSDEAEIDGLRLPAELLGRSGSERGTPEAASLETSDELLELDAEEFESLADDDVDPAIDSMEEIDPELADSLESFDGPVLEVEPDDSLESLDDDAVELEDYGVEEPDRADRTMMVRGYQPPAPFGGAQPPPLLEPEPEPIGRSSTTLASEEGSDERSSTLAPLGEDDPRSPDELETTLPPGAVTMGGSARSTFAPDPDGVPSVVEAEPTPSPVSSTRATIIPQEPDVDLDLGDDDEPLHRSSGMTAPSREADSAAASGHFSVSELGLEDLPDLEASTTTIPPVDLDTVDDSGALTAEGTVIARAPMPPSPFGAGRASEPVRPVRLLMIGAKGQVVAERRIEAGTHLDIGRMPGEPWASDRRMEVLHARLFPAPGGLIVDDFGAPQGVYTKISDTIAVEDGDEFKVGQARLALQRVVGPGGVWGQLTLVRHDDPSPSTYRLDRNEVLIGRDEGDITLPNDTFVSGDHCRFGREGNAVYLEDLGSSNGTYIRVRAGQCVAFGGMLLIGHTQFRVEPA